MKVLSAIIVWSLLCASQVLAGKEPLPVYIGLDAEFGLQNSTSAQAIERGILIAIDEINRAGGVLGGRPIRLISKDNRSVTARGIHNLKTFAEIPDMVAVYVGRFSPVALEYIGLAHNLQMILLDPWAAADAITNNGRDPNFAFRLSLKDSLAMPTMFRHALKKGIKQVGLLLPNTSWGRSNLEAATRYYQDTPHPRTVETAWYQWGDQSMLEKYQTLRAAGAEAIIFVANDTEAVVLCRDLVRLPADQRVPIISHWGVTGGNFASLVGDDLDKIDFSVIQTFSFFKVEQEMLERVMAVSKRLFDISRIEEIESPVGVGHAYDLTHILARAIDIAGTTDRRAVRDALEQVKNYRGLVKSFDQPFTPSNHDALGLDDVFMAIYRTDGAIVPLGKDGD